MLNFTICINLELKSGSFSFVFKTLLFSDIYYCWHQVRCERETYETRGTDWVSCPVSQSIHHLQLCFSCVCICVCLSNNPPPPTLFCFCVSLMPCLPINPPVHHLRLCFSRICICLNPCLQNPNQSTMQLCLFLYLDFNTCLSLNHPPIFIIDVRRKKGFSWSWHYEFQSANQGTGLTKLRRDFFYFSHKQARSFR